MKDLTQTRTHFPKVTQLVSGIQIQIYEVQSQFLNPYTAWEQMREGLCRKATGWCLQVPGRRWRGAVAGPGPDSPAGPDVHTQAWRAVYTCSFSEPGKRPLNLPCKARVSVLLVVCDMVEGKEVYVETSKT